MDKKKIFISFSSKDTNDAKRICNLLEENGFSCFICFRDLVAGEEYASQLVSNIDESDAVVLLLSERSNHSPHVLREVEYAVSNRIPIVVYSLEEVELSKSMSYYLMTHHWIPCAENRDEKLIEGTKYVTSGENNKKTSTNNDKIAVGEDDKKAVLAEEDKDNKDNRGNFVKKNLVKILGIVLIAALIVLAGYAISSSKNTGEEKTDETQNVATNSPEASMNDPESESPTLPPSTDGANTNAETPDNDNNTITPEAQKEYEVGEHVVFGEYLEEKIDWRVLKINDDGTLVMIANDILSFKIFDAPEYGQYNYYDGVDYFSYENHIIKDNDELLVGVRGNNDWSISNIRTWLNSEKEVVQYIDQAPDRKASATNFYSSEPGFLFGFSEEEKSAIVTVANMTKANSLSSENDEGYVKTEDKVYLLSAKELEMLKNAGISIYAKPNEACKWQDNGESNYNYLSEVFKVDSYYWWLRDSDKEIDDGDEPLNANEAWAVVSEYTTAYDIEKSSVGICAYGVRPVICIDPSKLTK